MPFLCLHVLLIVRTILIAHELRAWLLHYSAVVLHGVLPQEYYQHHLLLVEGVFLLLKEEVANEDIEQSTRLLQHYCFMFPFLYGKFGYLSYIDSSTLAAWTSPEYKK